LRVLNELDPIPSGDPDVIPASVPEPIVIHVSPWFVE
jgi:hypothetical protein